MPLLYRKLRAILSTSARLTTQHTYFILGSYERQSSRVFRKKWNLISGAPDWISSCNYWRRRRRCSSPRPAPCFGPFADQVPASGVPLPPPHALGLADKVSQRWRDLYNIPGPKAPPGYSAGRVEGHRSNSLRVSRGGAGILFQFLLLTMTVKLSLLLLSLLPSLFFPSQNLPTSTT